MYGLTHACIVKKATLHTKNRFATAILKNPIWIEKCLAGAICDTILDDSAYHTLPRSIWALRKLTEEILDCSNKDDLKLAFLLSWASHYLTDPIWVNHIAVTRLMTEAGWPERSKFDNGIEALVDKRMPEFLASRIVFDNIGYWNGFWKTYSQMEAKAPFILKAWRQGRRDDCVDFCLQNVVKATQVFKNYLEYLGLREKFDRDGIISLLGNDDNSGFILDCLIDTSDELFGAEGRDRAFPFWIGHYLLGKNWTGEDLLHNIFSPEFAEELEPVRGYKDHGIMYYPEAEISPEAKEDRKRWDRKKEEWFDRWDKINTEREATCP